MDLLPDELLLKIFELLPINYTTNLCPSVCRRWETLLDSRSLIIRAKGDTSRLNGCLRSVLVMGRMDPLPFQSFTKHLADYSPLLRSLTVYDIYSFTNKEIEDLAGFPNLEHLDIFPRARLCGSELAPVALKIKSLVLNKNILAPLLRDLTNSQLTDIHMYGNAMYYDTKLLRAVLNLRAEYLQDLTLRCAGLVLDDYKQIGECFNLTSLRLYTCWLMSSQEIMYITKPRKLHTLHMTGTRFVRRYALKRFLENLQQSVKELVLSGSCFGDFHVPILLKRNSSLRVLELWKTKVTSEGILSLAFSLPSLIVLDLDLELSTHQLQTLETHPSLRTLRCLNELLYKSLKNDDSCDTDQYQYKWQGVEIGEQFPAIYNVRKTINDDKLSLISTDPKFFQMHFRQGFRQGLASLDGFRGSLFYFWTRDKDVTPKNLYFNELPIAPP